MWFKQLMICLVCALTCLTVLPVFVIGGGLALFIYAVFAESREFVIGRLERSRTVPTPERSLDASGPLI